jgi:hypothetical protein
MEAGVSPHEVGTVEKDGKPVQFFEMTLRRVGP